MEDPFNTSGERTVYDRIKQMLVSYAFFPGDRLQVPDLADQLRVSATPVREALSRLCAEGLLTAVPHRGFFVKKLDRGEIADLLGMKHMLLSYATGHVSGDFKWDEVEGAILSKLAGLGDLTAEADEAVATYERYATAMIMLIGALAANAALLSCLENVMDRLHFVRQTEARLPELSQTVLCEGAGLAQALLDKRVKDVRAQLKQQHLREQETLAALMKECVNRLYLRSQPPAVPPERRLWLAAVSA